MANPLSRPLCILQHTEPAFSHFYYWLVLYAITEDRESSIPGPSTKSVANSLSYPLPRSLSEFFFSRKGPIHHRPSGLASLSKAEP